MSDTLGRRDGFTPIALVDPDGFSYGISTDKATYALNTIDYEHHEIHAGSSFTVSDTQACNTTTLKWMVVTPDSTKYAHMLFELSSTGEATYLVTEGADRVAGTNLPAVNRRRVGTPPSSTVTVSRTPTDGTTDGATILYSRRSGITSVASKNVEGGFARGVHEWVLKPNTKYIVSITTYAEVYVSLLLDWYEHTDKE